MELVLEINLDKATAVLVLELTNSLHNLNKWEKRWLLRVALAAKRIILMDWKSKAMPCIDLWAIALLIIAKCERTPFIHADKMDINALRQQLLLELYLNIWHVGWSSFTCLSHMLCGQVKFETHRKQKTTEAIFRGASFVCLVGVFHSKLLPLSFCLFYCSLSSRIPWYKSKLIILSLNRCGPMTADFQHFGDKYLFFLDSAKGAQPQHNGSAHSVTLLLLRSHCPTCQSWVNACHARYEKTPTNQILFPQPNQCCPLGHVYL